MEPRIVGLADGPGDDLLQVLDSGVCLFGGYPPGCEVFDHAG